MILEKYNLVVDRIALCPLQVINQATTGGTGASCGVRLTEHTGDCLQAGNIETLLGHFLQQRLRVINIIDKVTGMFCRNWNGQTSGGVDDVTLGDLVKEGLVV